MNKNGEFKLLDLQKKFETGSIKENEMTDVEKEQLLALYKLQVKGLDDETYEIFHKQDDSIGNQMPKISL
jgi:hypothetical protein